MKKSRTGSMVSKEWIQATRTYFSSLFLFGVMMAGAPMRDTSLCHAHLTSYGQPSSVASDFVGVEDSVCGAGSSESAGVLRLDADRCALRPLTHVQGGMVRGSAFCPVAPPCYQAWAIPTASQISR